MDRARLAPWPSPCGDGGAGPRREAHLAAGAGSTESPECDRVQWPQQMGTGSVSWRIARETDAEIETNCARISSFLSNCVLWLPHCVSPWTFCRWAVTRERLSGFLWTCSSFSRHDLIHPIPVFSDGKVGALASASAVTLRSVSKCSNFISEVCEGSKKKKNFWVLKRVLWQSHSHEIVRK